MRHSVEVVSLGCPANEWSEASTSDPITESCRGAQRKVQLIISSPPQKVVYWREIHPFTKQAAFIASFWPFPTSLVLLGFRTSLHLPIIIAVATPAIRLFTANEEISKTRAAANAFQHKPCQHSTQGTRETRPTRPRPTEEQHSNAL
jgi:hypothetical protein